MTDTMKSDPILVNGEPVPTYALGIRNVLREPLTWYQIWEHGVLFGESGIKSRAFDGLAPIR